MLGALAIDYARRRASISGRNVPLTATEFDLLRALSSNAWRVMSYQKLLHLVWGRRGSDDTDGVRTAVKKLRQKLAADATAPQYHLHRTRHRLQLRRPRAWVEERSDACSRLRIRPLPRGASQCPLQLHVGGCRAFGIPSVIDYLHLRVPLEPWRLDGMSLLDERAVSQSRTGLSADREWPLHLPDLGCRLPRAILDSVAQDGGSSELHWLPAASMMSVPALLETRHRMPADRRDRNGVAANA